MPAVLLELGFMDSATDVPIILTEDYADKCAAAIVEVVVAKGGLKKKTNEAKSVIISLPVLQKGSKGPEVGTLQRLLSTMGYKDQYGNPLEIDESFGGKTEYAVEQFQSDEGIETDKKVGKDTWRHLLGIK